MKYTIGLIVAVILVTAGVLIYASLRSDETPTGPTQEQGQQGVINTPKKGVKRFTLTPKQEGVKGDGSITLKETLSSMAVRFIDAPAPGEGMDYEVYIVPKGGEPILAGPMITIQSPNEKYLWAGAGAVSWYDAEKVLVTKRTKAGVKPGTVVAEAVIPEKGEAPPQ